MDHDEKGFDHYGLRFYWGKRWWLIGLTLLPEHFEIEVKRKSPSVNLSPRHKTRPRVVQEEAS